MISPPAVARRLSDDAVTIPVSAMFLSLRRVDLEPFNAEQVCSFCCEGSLSPRFILVNHRGPIELAINNAPSQPTSNAPIIKAHGAFMSITEHETNTPGRSLSAGEIYIEMKRRLERGARAAMATVVK